MLGIFLDSETNGLNVRKHHIIDLAYKIVSLSTGNVVETVETRIAMSKKEWDKSDPESLSVTGLSWEDVATGPSRREVMRKIILSFQQSKIQRGKAVFICQNPSFDRVFFSKLINPATQEKLLWPYHWLDLASMYWALSLQKEKRLPWKTGISKNAIAQALHLPPEVSPHKAINGVNHLFLCYQTLIGFGIDPSSDPETSSPL